MPQTLKKQAFTLTLANLFTRGLGFCFRLMTARLMGAEAIGLMELSSSASMLALTPVTAGLPSAMSHLTAHREKEQSAVLRSGLTLVRKLSLLLIPALLLLAPGIAYLLGDMRTLPSILIGLPGIYFMGCCGVYSGWFYGRSDTRTPALCECVEQTIRFLVSLVLLLWFSGSSLPLRAAMPGLAGLVAGVVVVILFHHFTPLVLPSAPSRMLERRLLHLSAPTAVSRLCQTCMRMMTAVLLPVCLRRSGLSNTAAISQYGLLNGMAMPFVMLPGIVTSAICMVATPAVSRQQQLDTLRKTMRKLLLSGGAIGLVCCLGLMLFADLIAMLFFQEVALISVLRVLSPLSFLFALQQVQFGLITGLGIQRRAMTGTLISSCLTLVLIALLCPLPQLRIFGAALAMLGGSLLRVVWNAVLLHQSVRAR